MRSIIDTLVVNPVTGQWTSSNDTRQHGTLSTLPGGQPILTLSTQRELAESTKEYLGVRSFYLQSQVHKNIIVGWIRPGTPFFSLAEGPVFYPEYVIRGKIDLDEGLPVFDTVTFSFKSNLWGQLDHEYRDGASVVKRPDQQIKIQETSDYKISISLGSIEEFRSSPPSYSIEANTIEITVKKKAPRFKDLEEVVQIFTKLSNYLCIACEAPVALHGIRITQGDDRVDAELNIPFINEDIIVNKEAPLLDVVTIEEFTALIESTLSTFIDKYEELTGLVQNLTSYIKGRTGSMYKEMHVSLLLQAVDMTVTQHHKNLSPYQAKEKARKEQEYKAFKQTAKDILKTLSPELKMFLNNASKHYTDLSFAEKIKSLTMEFRPIVWMNTGNIEATVEARNDLMHGRGVDYSGNGWVFDRSSGVERDLEILVICYLLKECGAAEGLLKTVGQKLRGKP